MVQGIISRRYATALWIYAKRNGQEDRVLTEVRIINNSFSRYESLKRVLSNRTLPKEKKIDLIAVLVGTDISNVLRNFVRLLFTNHREEFLRTICLSYESIYLKENKILKAGLVTAVPVDATTEQRFIDKIEKETGYSIHLSSVVNPSILGGCVITVDTWRLDASVTNKLKRIKESLLEKELNFLRL